MTPGTPTVTRRVSANGSATTEPQQRSTPVDQPNLSQPVLRGRDGAEDIADRAAPFDALLVQAARSPLRRFLPNSSTARFAAGLARHPLRHRSAAHRPGR